MGGNTSDPPHGTRNFFKEKQKREWIAEQETLGNDSKGYVSNGMKHKLRTFLQQPGVSKFNLTGMISVFIKLSILCEPRYTRTIMLDQSRCRTIVIEMTH